MPELGAVDSELAHGVIKFALPEALTIAVVFIFRILFILFDNNVKLNYMVKNIN